VPKTTKVTIKLSALLRLVYTTLLSRARQDPPKDVMGFLEGVVREEKARCDIEICSFHPVLEEEFMEKPFAREVFVGGKKLAAKLAQAKKASGSPRPQLVGWYHTHSKESAVMSVMDKINHLSLLDITVSDEEGEVQGTLENMFEGKRDATASKKGEGSIIHEGGVGLVFSPPLFLKKATFNRYLKLYYFGSKKDEKTILLSHFKELRSCNIRTDLADTLLLMSELASELGAGRTAASRATGPGSKAGPGTLTDSRTMKQKKPAGKGAKSSKKTRKKLDKQCLDTYAKKEEGLRKRIERIKKMIENREDISSITSYLKETRDYIDKLGKLLQRDMKTVQDSKGANGTMLRTDCAILVRKLREHSTELDKLISEMYYKVLTDLSDEGISPP